MPDLVPPGRAHQDFWWSLGRALIGPFMWLLFRFRVVGLANLPAEGGGVVASNHVSVFDPVVLGLLAARRGRTVRFIGAVENFRIPVIGWGLRKIRQIPIVRGGQDLAALEDAARIVRSGALAGIYPEGSVGPGPLMRGRSGAARLALASGGALVPVGIWGTNARWSKRGLSLRPPWRPTVAVCIGAPIAAEGDPESTEDVQRMTDRLMAEIGRQVMAARAIARHP
ncbi:MAG: lysophospholipid acyltransferase family protein [Actinomycetota bacterium]